MSVLEKHQSNKVKEVNSAVLNICSQVNSIKKISKYGTGYKNVIIRKFITLSLLISVLGIINTSKLKCITNLGINFIKIWKNRVYPKFGTFLIIIPKFTMQTS